MNTKMRSLASVLLLSLVASVYLATRGGGAAPSRIFPLHEGPTNSSTIARPSQEETPTQTIAPPLRQGATPIEQHDGPEAWNTLRRASALYSGDEVSEWDEAVDALAQFIDQEDLANRIGEYLRSGAGDEAHRMSLVFALGRCKRRAARTVLADLFAKEPDMRVLRALMLAIIQEGSVRKYPLRPRGSTAKNSIFCLASIKCRLTDPETASTIASRWTDVSSGADTRTSKLLLSVLCYSTDVSADAEKVVLSVLSDPGSRLAERVLADLGQVEQHSDGVLRRALEIARSRSGSPAMRQAAIQVARSHQDSPDVAASLRFIASDTGVDPQTRVAAACALPDSCSNERRELLFGFIRSEPDEGIRAAATLGLTNDFTEQDAEWVAHRFREVPSNAQSETLALMQLAFRVLRMPDAVSRDAVAQIRAAATQVIRPESSEEVRLAFVYLLHAAGQSGDSAASAELRRLATQDPSVTIRNEARRLAPSDSDK